MGLIFTLINIVLEVFSLLLLAYLLIGLLKPNANRWTELIRSLVEPVLQPTRALLGRVLPASVNNGIDWSPLAVLIVIRLLRIFI